MPRLTIKELQAQIATRKRENRLLRQQAVSLNTEHEKTRRYLSDQIAQLREALRNEQDNSQALRRLMNESRAKQPSPRFDFKTPPLHPIAPAQGPRLIATHLL